MSKTTHIFFYIQGVPLATGPGISLIILTPMKILQRNLNRSTFVVWEMWRHNDMCWKWPPFAPRQDWTRQAIFWKVLAASFRRDLATALARSDAAWLYLMGISEWESLPKQTTNHRRLETKHHRRNSGSESGRTGKDFPKYGAPGLILSGRKWWPLSAHVMMSSHFSHKERTPVQISLQYLHWC